MKKVKLALFDIDGTIFRSSLLIELISGLVDYGVFPINARREMERERKAWLDRVGTYDGYLMSVVKVHLKYIKGSQWTAVEHVVEKIIERHKDRVHRFTRDLVKELKKKKYTLVSISGSPDYMVRRFTEHMGFDYAMGQELEVKNGIFTGKILNKDFYEKEKVLARFVKNEKLKVDWKGSVAVGDTDTDIPMLERVGRPIAFNPNRTFAEYALKKGWEVVVERKDAIFRIDTCTILPYVGMKSSR